MARTEYEKDVERARRLDRDFADSFCDLKHFTKDELRAKLKERERIRLCSNI